MACTLIVTKIKYVNVAFFLGKMVHRFCPTPSFLRKRTAAPHLDQSSAHLRQQESTIFWSFSRSWYTLQQTVASNLRREEKNYAFGRRVEGKTTGWSSVKAAVGVLGLDTLGSGTSGGGLRICVWFHSSGNDTVHVCACWQEAFDEWCWRDECKPHVGFWHHGSTSLLTEVRFQSVAL